MNKELPVDVLIRHLQGRREALRQEMCELQTQLDRLDGAINETIVMEMQLKNGMISVPRVSCE